MTRTFSCIFWLIVAFKVLNNQPLATFLRIESTILFEWYLDSLWHFATGQKTFTKRMNWTKFTDIVKSGKRGFQLKINTCILNTKPLSCSYKRFSDCPIHTNVVQECCWIAYSVVKILMNGFWALLNFRSEINIATLKNALQNTRQSRNDFFPSLALT